MKKFIVEIIVLALIVIGLDVIVLNLFGSYFQNQVLVVQKSPLQMDLNAAIFCYIMIVFVLYYFVILERKNIKDAFLLGFSIYAIYELTSKSLLRNWKWETVLMDSVWGGVLFSGTLFLYKKIMPFLRESIL